VSVITHVYSCLSSVLIFTDCDTGHDLVGVGSTFVKAMVLGNVITCVINKLSRVKKITVSALW
jgi:hypothetical protein